MVRARTSHGVSPTVTTYRVASPLADLTTAALAEELTGLVVAFMG
jgi:hypothetical protein